MISNVVVGADGIVSIYDKLHMANHGECAEPRWFTPGDSRVALFTIDGVNFGVAICYDARFPLFWRRMAELGAHVILAPVAWPRDSGQRLLRRESATSTGSPSANNAGFDSWHPTIIARAVENQLYVVSVSRAGHHFGNRFKRRSNESMFYPHHLIIIVVVVFESTHSIVVGPWVEAPSRRLLTRDDGVPEPRLLGVDEGELSFDVDLDYIKHIRTEVALRAADRDYSR